MGNVRKRRKKRIRKMHSSKRRRMKKEKRQTKSRWRRKHNKSKRREREKIMEAEESKEKEIKESTEGGSQTRQYPEAKSAKAIENNTGLRKTCCKGARTREPGGAEDWVEWSRGEGRV